MSVSAGGLAVGRLGGEDLVSWTQDGGLGLLDTLEVAGWRDRTGGNTAVNREVMMVFWLIMFFSGVQN